MSEEKNTPIKPGIKTTEGWIVLALNVLGVLAIFGLITVPQRAAIEKAVPELIVAIAVILGGLDTLWAKFRTTAKKG